MISNTSNPARTDLTNEDEGPDIVRVSLKGELCSVLLNPLNSDYYELAFFRILNFGRQLERPRSLEGFLNLTADKLGLTASGLCKDSAADATVDSCGCPLKNDCLVTTVLTGNSKETADHV